VGIVQGLLHQPRLIMLDEPTSGLDPLMQQKFFNLIREENRRGTTIFFSSHILSEVQRLCNRVAIIKEGKIIDLQDIQTLQKSNFKKVLIKGDSLEEDPFMIDGVSGLEKSNGGLSFFYKGDINAITCLLSGSRITDLNIEDLTLEEIFMHYYE
jgi:ABC-2 type transport system ATP-binding protein